MNGKIVDNRAAIAELRAQLKEAQRIEAEAHASCARLQADIIKLVRGMK